MRERWTSRLGAPWQARAQLDVGSDRLRLQVLRRGLRTLKLDHAFAEMVMPVHSSLADAMSSLLGGAATKLGRTRVDVTLDDTVVRRFSVMPPAGVRALADLRAAAALRFERLYGESLDGGWRFDAAWHARRSFVVVAMPCATQDALLEPLAAARWPVRSMAPNFVRQWQAQRGRLNRSGIWLVVRGTTESVTVWARADDGDRVRQGRALTSTWTDAAALTRWIESEALQLDLDMPSTVVVCGSENDDLGVEQQHIGGFTVIGSASAVPILAAPGASV